MTRRSWYLVCGAIGLLALSVSIVAAEKEAEAEVSVQRYEKVEVLQSPWGWIRWTMNAEADPEAEMTFGVVYIKPHQVNPAHLHPNSAEYLHVLEGSCDHLVGKKWVKLKAGDTLRIPKNVPHRARTGKEACKVVVVYNTGKRQFVEVEDQK